MNSFTVMSIFSHFNWSPSLIKSVSESKYKHHFSHAHIFDLYKGEQDEAERGCSVRVCFVAQQNLGQEGIGSYLWLLSVCMSLEPTDEKNWTIRFLGLKYYALRGGKNNPRGAEVVLLYWRMNYSYISTLNLYDSHININFCAYFQRWISVIAWIQRAAIVRKSNSMLGVIRKEIKS